MRFLRRIWFLLTRRSRDRDLQAEIESHIDALAEDLVANGMSPEDARFEARRRFGNATNVWDESRSIWTFPRLDAFLLDLRHAFRSVRRSRAVVALAVLAFAIGIGANTAVFSLLNTVVFHPFPFIPHAERVMWMFETNGTVDIEQELVEPANLADWKRQSRTFEAFSGIQFGMFTMTGNGAAERVRGFKVTPDFFTVMDVKPVLGRVFREDDDLVVAVLTDSFWRRQFNADPNVVGRKATLNGVDFTIIGVLPPGFTFPRNRTRFGVDMYVPLPIGFDGWTDRKTPYFAVMGRLKAGVAHAQAQAEMDTIANRLAQQYPEVNRGRGIAAVPIEKLFTKRQRTPFYALMAGVGLLLLIACANVAGLLLAHGTTRRRELAIRCTMGAERARLVRQLLIESCVVAVLGAAAGLLLALVTLRLLQLRLPESIVLETPRFRDIGIDGSVLIVTVGLTTVAGLIAGIVPAFRLSKIDLAGALKEGAPNVSAGHRRLHGGLIAAQVALSVVLLAGAGLTLRSLIVLSNRTIGARSQDIAVLRLPIDDHLADPKQRLQTFDQFVERISALPGVENVAVASSLPTDGNGFSDPHFWIEGLPKPDPSATPWAALKAVSPNYFRTFEMPIVRGRAFDDHDRINSPRVIIISRATARRLFGDADPIGKQIHLDDDSFTESKAWEIVGVAGDVVSDTELLYSQSAGALYVPFEQAVPWHAVQLAVGGKNATGLGRDARTAVLGVDPKQVVDDIQAIEDIVHEMFSTQRVMVGLLSALAVLAVILAAIGIFGLVSYAVSQRAREIGIRIAIGGTSTAVVGLFVRQGLRPVALGTLVGFALAVPALPSVQSFFFLPAVGLLLPVLVVAAFFSVIAAVAVIIPARRASRVDPMTVLRVE